MTLALLLLAPLQVLAPAVPPPRVELDAELARRVRAYAWDQGARVPTPEGLSAGAVPFGEAGLAPDARLYVRCGGAEPRDLAAARELVLEPGAAEPVEGRYGAGLRLRGGPAPLAAAAGGDAPLLVPPFALDLWVRPLEEPGEKAGNLLEAPGAFSLVRLKDGRLGLFTVGRKDAVLAPPVRAEAGAWIHVGLALDGPELDHALRLVVDGAAQGCPAPAELVPALARAAELRVGGLACDVDELSVLGRALTTEELLLRREPPVDVGPHRLRLALDDGSERELAPWAGVLTAPWADDAETLGLAARDHLILRSQGLAWIEGQWREDRPLVRPMARTTHPTLFLGDHRVLIYGGETRDTHVWPWRNTDDTWIYDTQAASWRRLAGPAPSPRCHQAAAFSPDHGLVLYPGGWRNDRLGIETYADTWVFHAAEERWELRTPAGLPLGPIADAAVVYHAALKRFILVRGRSVLAYDPAEDRYDAVPPPVVVDGDGAPSAYLPGDSPIGGYDPDTGWIVLFGGWDGKETFLDTTLHYDVAGRRAVALDLPGSPSPRVRSAFARDSRRGRFVLYGGVQDQYSRREADLWTYVPREARWRRAEAADGPGRRGGFYSMAYDPDLDRFFLLCGRSRVEGFHNDAWRLSLDPEAPGLATFVFDRAAFAPRARFAASVSGDDSPAFSFSSSDDGATWSPWQADPSGGPAAGARFLKVEVRLAARPDAPPSLRAIGFTDADPAELGPHVFELAR
jgi:hypothetical protein